MKVQVLCFALLLSGPLVCGCAPKAVPEAAADQAESESSDSQPTESTSAESKSAEGSADASEYKLPDLGAQLTALSAKNKEMMPAEMVQTFVDGIGEVRATGIVESALGIGAKAVDGELPDAKGNRVKLSELWAKGPVVIVWYRGGWCPYCNMQLQAMQGTLPAIKAAGGTLVAITPETPDNSLSTSEKNELEFVVLSDVGNELAKKYGVVFKLPAKVSPLYKQFNIDLAKSNGNDSDELPLAATYVIDTSGEIRYAFLDADYTKRAEPAEVVEALQSL